MTNEKWDKLSVEEQNEEISKHTKCSDFSDYPYYVRPFYTLDLNAMHEAEEMLTDEQLNRYNGMLAGMCLDSRNATTTKQIRKAILHQYRPTAAQRAKAFVFVMEPE